LYLRIMIVFVNGHLGYGSPLGGRAYWSRSFVEGALRYFNDTDEPYFTDVQYDALSVALKRRADGNLYALEHPAIFQPYILESDGSQLSLPLSDHLQHGTIHQYPLQHAAPPPAHSPARQPVRFVSHSMGGAFACGMMDFLADRGIPIDAAIFINIFQPEGCTVPPGLGIRTVDYRITNDPVLNLLDWPRRRGDIPYADIRLRERADAPLNFRHKLPISSRMDFWSKL